MTDAFFDTNVLLYLIAPDESKAGAAEEVLATGGHVSVQVLNEFTSVARRKARLAWHEIDEVLGLVRSVCSVHPLMLETHDRARRIAEHSGIGFYDSLIVASASLAGCRVLYSEDLQHDQRFDGAVTVRNPFRA